MIDDNRYLIACSGGPDSMALLDMYRQKHYVEVGHVNYHKRDSAYRDERIVRNYCRKYKIKFHKLDFDPLTVKGNFQNAARTARYEFFNKLCKKHKLQATLVAHHKDDNIETYLMQIDKKIGVSHYGLDSVTYLYGVKVIRPLLAYTKDELLDYCDKNNIEYGIDETNLEDHYERNRVRHSRVEKLSVKQKNNIVSKINKKNEKKVDELNKALAIFNSKDNFEVNEFIKIPHIQSVLRFFFEGKSDKYFKEMLRQLKDSKSCYFSNGVFYISKEYDQINVFMFEGSYSYTFKSMADLKTKDYGYFKIGKKGLNVEGVTVKKSDFPITIRTYQAGDYICMLYGSKKINRFFIDNKLKLEDRLSYPIVCNKKNEVILLPNVGCDKEHYSNKHNLFVIKK